MTQPIDIRDAWDRVHRWLDGYAPELMRKLRPPASEETLRRAEAALGTEFPSDFRASVRIHDGAPGLVGGWDLERLTGVVTSWRIQNDLVVEGVSSTEDDDSIAVVGPVRPRWWCPMWIPIAGDGAGNAMSIDLAPAEGGVAGQIIHWWHDFPKRIVVASSFGDWFCRFADELENGKWVAHRSAVGSVMYLTDRASLSKADETDME